MSSDRSESAKDLTDRLLTELGESLSISGFNTDASGLARLSVPGLGMVDFELYDEMRMLGMFANVGPAPDDISDLLRLPLEHGEMAGFWFSLDGFKTQVYLSGALPVDGLDKDMFKSYYNRFVQCGFYWLENLRTLGDPPSASPGLDSTDQVISA